MWWRTLFLGLVSSLLLATPTRAALLAPGWQPTVVEEVAGVSVVRWRLYTYQDQVLWVVGEIANASTSTVLAPAVVARFTDPAGMPVLEAESAADAAYLRPGERSTFRVTVLHPPPFLQLAALTVKGDPSASVWPLDGAQVVEARGAFEEVEQDQIHTIAGCDPEKHDCFFVERVKVRTDNYRVEGTVVNTASQPVRNVRVTVALFDAEGRLVNVGVGPLAPPTLLPGQRAGFAVLVYWAPGTVRFEARAHSDD